jgi:hypothetical protein
MDELHCTYRKTGGYALDPNTVVSSRGYCDDTAILSDNLEALQTMNDQTFEFFNKHNLHINVTKTKITGINAGGSALTPDNHTRITWPGTNNALTLVPPDQPIRYLGAHVCMTLNWDKHISTMHAKVFSTISALKRKRLSLYQACLITNYVTGPCLEIGFRHADIPPEISAQWDTWLASALATRANLSSASLHYSTIFTICKITPFAARHITAQTLQTLNSLNVPSELTNYYRDNLTTEISGLDSLDLSITRNAKSCTRKNKS